MADVLLAVSELAIDAGEARLLEGLTFEVGGGQSVALTGPSGCGKTTLLRALAGLDDPAAGAVRFRGRSPLQLGWPRYRRHVVFVHQRPVMLEATVEENLRRPLRHHAVDRAFDAEVVAGRLAAVGLSRDHLRRPARTLSIGQQQRVSLIRALQLDPEVLLLDEPTAALDEESRESVEAMVREHCARKQKGAVLVTHDRAQAERLCSRTIDLRPYLTAAGGGRSDG